jgi:endo-1,4-beta-xylanase
MNLKDKWESYFPIGTAVSPTTIETHHELITSQFKSITCENAMKFGMIHPQEDSYDFADADKIAEFVRKNELILRGHTLVWHNQTSEWLFEDTTGSLASTEQVMGRLKAHMAQVMPRYKDIIYAWDVVNEAISDADDEYLRPTKWLDSCGENFIEEAFRMAHAIDPNAKLFYNDYNATLPNKRKKIIQLIKDLKAKNVPIHGVGLQGHFNIFFPSMAIIREALEEYAALGIEIHITELDVSVFAFEDKTSLPEATPELLKLQAEYYRDLFMLFKEFSHVITSVTLWGCADDHTWLSDFPVRNRKNWPLLFDDQKQPKLAYDYLMNI